MLKDTPLDPDFPMEGLARRAVGYSGSDLKELCRNAAMRPFREFTATLEQGKRTLDRDELQGFIQRPLTIADFFVTEDLEYSSLDMLPPPQDRSRIDDFPAEDMD